MPTDLISIIIPCFNEEKNIDELNVKLVRVLDSYNLNFEIICIDDGSEDDTWGALKRFKDSDKKARIKIFRHSKNYGMTGAYQTGFNVVKGSYIVTYSSDNEIPAEAIMTVIEKLDQGYDIVNTYRKNRWKNTGISSLYRAFPSFCANWLIKFLSGVNIKDSGSGLKGFKSFVVKDVVLHGEVHRFLVQYLSTSTKKITEFEVDYHERIHGKSSYGSINRTLKVILDLFTLKFMLSFATKPFLMMPGRIFGFTGLFFEFLGIIITIYLISIKIFLQESIGNRPLLSIGVLFVVLGVQLIMTGLLGELLLRIFYDNKTRTPYIISESIL